MTVIEKFDKKYLDAFMKARKKAAFQSEANEDFELMFNMIDRLADMVCLQRSRIEKLEERLK